MERCNDRENMKILEKGKTNVIYKNKKCNMKQ